MLLTINNNTKHNDIAYQYIQADIDKMNSFIVNIEQKADKLIPLIPPNLKNDISSLKKQSHQLSLSYSSINYNQYRNKLKITKDSLEDLSQKVLSHVRNDPGFNPTKTYAESFYKDVQSRILNTTKQQCSNLEFCVESELRALTNKSQTSAPLTNNLPRFDTPSPKIVFYRKKSPSDEKEKIILTIKDQTERLSEIYSKIIKLKSLQKNKKNYNNGIDIEYLLNIQKNDTRALSELEMLHNVLNMKNNETSKEIKCQNTNNSENKIDYVMKEQLNSFEELSSSMIQSAKNRLEEAKSKVKEEIQMIRARLEILENRINEYGDFNGETNDMMIYIGMKVDEVINGNDNKNVESELIENKKNENLANIYLDVRTRIAKSSIDSQLESIKRSIRYIRFNRPLIS